MCKNALQASARKFYTWKTFYVFTSTGGLGTWGLSLSIIVESQGLAVRRCYFLFADCVASLGTYA
jgi:hypothetical protein